MRVQGDLDEGSNNHYMLVSWLRQVVLLVDSQLLEVVVSCDVKNSKRLGIPRIPVMIRNLLSC